MTYGLNDGSNVLVRTPASGDAARASQLSSLLARGPSADTALVVTYALSAAEVVERWRDRRGTLPATLHVIEVVPPERVSSAPRSVDAEPGVDAEAVAATDLVGLGAALRERLDAWTADRAVLYVDSLTRLLEGTSVETAFRFLHVATSQIQFADLTAYYALAPAAHDAQTVTTLRTLFDDVIALDASADGEAADAPCHD